MRGINSLIGHTLGKYRLLEEIGRGGMGVVYKAHDPVLDRTVAVKVLAPHLTWDPEFVQRFFREAQAAGRLHHSNVVAVYDAGQQGQTCFLVMEYVPGRPLHELVHRAGPLPVDRVIPILGQVAAALDYAHHQGLVHRDVKSGNILVTPEGRVVLTDFGLARAVEGTKLTQSGVLLGTPAYMAPEQVRGQKVGPATDVYALGIVAYELLTGRVPFQADTPHALLHAQVYEPPPPLRQANPEVPPPVEEVVLKALAKPPGQRYASAGAFVQDLQAATEGRWPVTAPPQRPSTADRRPPARESVARGRNWPWLIFGGVVALLVIVGLVFLTTADGGRLMVAFQPGNKVVGEQRSGGAGEQGSAGLAVTAAIPIATELPPPTTTPTSLPTNTTTPVPTAATPKAPLAEFSLTANALQRAATITPTTVPTVPRSNVIFVDNFNGSGLDTARWTLEQGIGNVVVRNGALRIASSRSQYPYIHSQDNYFPSTGNFQLTYRFRYSEVKDCGVGIIMTGYLVPAGLTQDEAARRQQTAEANGVQAGVWQDRQNGLQLWFRSGSDRVDVPFGGPDTNWHEMAIKYVGDQYMLYLDGRLAYTSRPTPYRPRYIWMGHPADLGVDCQWDTLEVDYIKVENLP